MNKDNLIACGVSLVIVLLLVLTGAATDQNLYAQNYGYGYGYQPVAATEVSNSFGTNHLNLSQGNKSIPSSTIVLDLSPDNSTKKVNQTLDNPFGISSELPSWEVILFWVLVVLLAIVAIVIFIILITERRDK